jgi:DNA polymerase I-like protein with 3'-5' exonuclease and polymerase domains
MWKEGIDTPDIPWNILESYLKQDLNLTYQIYLKQKEYFDTHPALYRLFYLEMVDLLVLQEMEWNGMRFDKEKSLALANETSNRLAALYSSLSFTCPVSFTSGDHISALLYGGTIKEKYRESYEVTLKSGEVKKKERWSIKEHQMPQLVKPLPKTEMAKKGFYATDKVTLQQLTHKRIGKETKQLIEALIEYGDLAHLNGTYYEGLPNQMNLHGDEEYIHGQYNQVVAVTGRLSSSKPNMQNRDKRIDHCFISRYD